ncbi:ABC transporter permease [Pseudonocardia sulfidoxydans]|uniref:ABC transporter permease n=1 Tax=Pseudonocardia sulfidoxydans TaxID=54011 RepID=UPI001C9A01F3|nr:ABC transporter permease [Pseudonocardia sulfidoxydans]
MLALTDPDRPWLLVGTIVALGVFFAIASPAFLSIRNFTNIGTQTAIVTIVAVGMTALIISGEIDLSVGAVLGLAGMMAAIVMRDVVNVWAVGVAVAVATGAVVGALNGWLTTRLMIPSFLVTLGMMGIARGISLSVTDTQPVLINNSSLSSVFGVGAFLYVPVPIWWTLVAVVVLGVLLHGATFGQRVYAVGGNATAARYSGVNTRKVKIWSFVLVGACVGLAAAVLTARTSAARPDFGTGLELDVIAAVILGGTSLFGGRGTVVATVLGSLLIGLLNNGLVLIGVSSSVQLVIKGIVIIGAVAMTNFGSLQRGAIH